MSGTLISRTANVREELDQLRHQSRLAADAAVALQLPMWLRGIVDVRSPPMSLLRTEDQIRLAFCLSGRPAFMLLRLADE